MYIHVHGLHDSCHNSLIISYINYGLLLWGFDCHKLEILQKKALRFMTNSSYIAHTAPLFIQHGVLIGCEPADLTMHPTPELPRVGSFFSYRCLVFPKKCPQRKA